MLLNVSRGGSDANGDKGGRPVDVMGAGLRACLNRGSSMNMERTDRRDDQLGLLRQRHQFFDVLCSNLHSCIVVRLGPIQGCWRELVHTWRRPSRVVLFQLVPHVVQLALIPSRDRPFQARGKLLADMFGRELAGVTGGSEEHNVVLFLGGRHGRIGSDTASSKVV